MLRKIAARWWRISIAVAIAVAPVGTLWAQGWQGNAPNVAWTNPGVAAIKSTGAVSGLAQSEDIHHINYDCQPRMYHMDYELFGSPLRPGCFTSTAFGSMDIASGAVEGFGSDGALQLKPANPKEVIVPLPKEATVATMYPAPILGAYMHLYLPSAPTLQHDWTGTPYLQLPPQPSTIVSDSFGNPILMNTQSIAFSTSGSWLVVESPWHSWLRINVATLEVLPFAEPFTGTFYDSALHEAQAAISDDGRYVALQSDEFNSFRVYDLKACTGTVTSDLKPLGCQSHDYSKFVSSKVSGWHLTRHLRFVNDGLLSFHATGDGGDDNYELAPSGSIDNLTEYLALGDSYTSGEGAFNYVEGTDTSNNMCHLSSNSYPFLLTRDVFNDGHSVACSGAVISDIVNGSSNYGGQTIDKTPLRDRVTSDDSFIPNTLGSFSPGYIPQSAFVQQYQPRVLTVSVGGDDIGFGDIIAACVSPIKQPWPPELNPNTCYGTYEQRLEIMNKINTTYTSWVSLYRQLQSMAPNTRIYTVGYPHIAKVGGDCGLNVHLNASEVEFSEQLIDYLNSVIQKAANDAGVTYIDITHALDGHRLCEASGQGVAMNGLTAGTDKFHVLGKESYHPNALGQELIEQAILHGTHNFTDPAPGAGATAPVTPPTAPVDSPVLNQPKSNQPVHMWLPDNTIADSLLVRGTKAPITVNGQGNSLAPNSTYNIRLRQDNLTLGTITSDESGNITTTIDLPSSTSTGEQVLDVTGQNQAGLPVDISKTVYIAAESNDYDGDGLVNDQDSCPNTANSGIDADKDGVDDACDSIIGLAVTSNNGGQQPGTGGNTNTSLPATSSITTEASTSPSSTNQLSSQATIAVAQTTALPDGSDSTAMTSTRTSTAPEASAILGDSTSQTTGKQSSSRTSRYAADNPPSIMWEPWAIDAALVLALLTLLSSLFGRMAERQIHNK